MKNTIIPLFALLLITSCGENKPADSVDTANDRNDVKFDEMEKDADFAVKAADGGMYEVMMADLALSKTSNADVKALAEMMKTDHSAANSELKGLAAQKGISMPDSMSNEKRKMYNDLAEKSGKDFDKEYVDMMVKDHKKDIELFETESEKGKDQDMRGWAASKLPVLRHHLEMAESTQDKVK